MPTVTIGTTDYEVYSDLDAADQFLDADFSATAWRAETDDDQKRRAKVSAFRTLNALSWAGEKADADQIPAWPRTGTGLSDIDDDEVPQEIIDAENLLAKYIHNGTVSVGSATTANNIRRQRAGSVEVEYFNPTLLVDPSQFPEDVMALIRRFLGGGSATFAGAIATGVHCPSGFCPGYGVSGP